MAWWSSTRSRRATTRSIFASSRTIRRISHRMPIGRSPAFGSINSPARPTPTRGRSCRSMPASAFCFSMASCTACRRSRGPTRRRYVPGQVYAAPGVDRNDVNPRPLSTLVPSSGLCGCFSGDEKQIMAVAWEPYQEIFQGVIACIHSDFRLGGLAPAKRRRSAARSTLCRPTCRTCEALRARFPGAVGQ